MKIKLEDAEKELSKKLAACGVHQKTFAVWLVRYGFESVKAAYDDVRGVQKDENIGTCMHGLLKLENTDANAQYEGKRDVLEPEPSPQVSGVRDESVRSPEARELAAKTLAEIRKSLPRGIIAS
jgi:hypothetical protein